MRQVRVLSAWALAAAGLTLLGGCGLRGDLQRPPPLLGPDHQRYKEEQARQRAAEEAAKAEAEAAKAEAQAEKAEAEAAKAAPKP